MSFTLPPYTDGQIVPGDGVKYIYEAANNRLKVLQNDVSELIPSSSLSAAAITPDKIAFAATFSVNTEPTSPTAGQAVVVGASPSGSFAGLTNHLEVWNGTSWTDVSPYEGLVVWDLVADTLKGWNGSAWAAVIPPAGFAPPDGSITTAALADNAVTPAKVDFNIVSRSLAAAPSSVAIGKQYIVKPTPSGGDAWFGQSGKLATKIGTGNASTDWAFTALASGKLYWIADEGELIGYNGSAQINIGPPTDASIPAIKLGALSDLSDAQRDNIAHAIATDADALAEIRVAMGVPTPFPSYLGGYASSQFQIGTPVIIRGTGLDDKAPGTTFTGSSTAGVVEYVSGGSEVTGHTVNYGTWLMCGLATIAAPHGFLCIRIA